MNPNLVTKAEFEAWKESRITKKLMNLLQEMRDAKANAILSGSTIGNESLTNNFIGFVQGVDLILTADLIEIEETEAEINDNKQEREYFS